MHSYMEIPILCYWDQNTKRVYFRFSEADKIINEISVKTVYSTGLFKICSRKLYFYQKYHQNLISLEITHIFVFSDLDLMVVRKLCFFYFWIKTTKTNRKTRQKNNQNTKQKPTFLNWIKNTKITPQKPTINNPFTKTKKWNEKIQKIKKKQPKKYQVLKSRRRH